MTRQPLMIESVSKPSFPQTTSYNHFWLGILAADSGHILAALLRGEVIHILYMIVTS